jgi:glutamine phosphoribosylpyrophosphate amidotransferase
MSKSELIQKRKNELEMYKRIQKDSLMYTKEERLKASSKVLVIVSMLVDVEELETLE